MLLTQLSVYFFPQFFIVTLSAFIASFYVGLGSALMVAGTVYISALLCPKEL